ncbi:5206_t:CDS:2 [Funneliformis geosporum]|nr:5206_t:CDS:2 [Funneliformis geosporum]
MKNKQKLRIIQIYFPTDTTTTKDHLNRVKIQNKLLDIILEAKFKGYHHVLMDRVLIRKDDQPNYLELDPTKVMEETSHHFQNIADLENSTKDSHPFWNL